MRSKPDVAPLAGAVAASTAALLAAASAETEEVGEHVAERGEDVVGASEPGAGHPRVPEAVVAGSLLGVGQHVVGLGGLLELRLGFGIVRIPVRVVLHRELAVELLELLLRRVFFRAEHLVVVTLVGHVELLAAGRCRAFALPKIVGRGVKQRHASYRPAL